jgi:hypothetical protein
MVVANHYFPARWMHAPLHGCKHAGNSMLGSNTIYSQWINRSNIRANIMHIIRWDRHANGTRD